MTEASAEGGAPQTSKALRWFFLLLVSVVIATNYYVYDAMSAIKATMQADLGISNTHYGILVSFYSFPNTFLFMTLIGGIILDRYGIRKVGLMFTLFCFLGALLTAYGTSETFRSGGFGHEFFGAFLTQFSPELKVMILGRLLYGLGAETSIVVINKVVVKWFKGKEMAFAFGVNLALARLGTAAALILSPTMIGEGVELWHTDAPVLSFFAGIYNSGVEAIGRVVAGTGLGWTSALWFATILMGTGLLFFIIYVMFDRAYDRSSRAGSLLDEDERFQVSDITDLLKNKAFIYISMLCVTFYSAVFPFQAYCPDFLHNKFGLSQNVSGTLTSVIIWGTIVFTPLFGYLVDKKGKRATLMVFGSGMLLAVHLSLALTYLTPFVAMFVLGIAFSLVPAAMWPGVARVVEEKRLGTAYGLMTWIQNLGLFAFPTLAGWVLDATNPTVKPELVEAGKASYDYTYTVLMFATLGLAGFLFSFLLKREDAKSGDRLELPEIAD